MVAEKVGQRPSLGAKLFWLLFSYLLFLAIYPISAKFASMQSDVPSCVFKFEEYIPFFPWMILPYMSSGLFFAFVFFICSTKTNLYTLVKRISFITIVSGFCFVLFPLQYSFLKPEVECPFLNYFFQFLNRWDSVYNQAPSLHISYICLYWTMINKELKGSWRIVLKICLLLQAVSTLTVYQHHFIDLIFSLSLVCICFFFFPFQSEAKKARNQKIVCVYVFFSSLLILLLLFYYEYSFLLSLLLLWFVVNLMLVACAYQFSDTQFLKRKDGSIAVFKKLIYFPYVLTYKIMWFFFRTRSANAPVEIMPQVFVGARLKSKETLEFNFDFQTIVFDLSAEMEENKLLRKSKTYYCRPFLDIASINRIQMDELLSLISQEYATIKPGVKIYIHCTMGYSRSMFLAILFLKKQLEISTEEAFDKLKNLFPQMHIPKYLYESID